MDDVLWFCLAWLLAGLGCALAWGALVRSGGVTTRPTKRGEPTEEVEGLRKRELL